MLFRPVARDNTPVASVQVFYEVNHEKKLVSAEGIFNLLIKREPSLPMSKSR